MDDILKVCSDLELGDFEKISIPFIGKGNIWVDLGINEFDDSKLIQHIIYSAITQTAPGQLSIIGYDKNLMGFLAPFSALSSGDMNIVKIISCDDELNSSFNMLYRQIQSVQNVMQGRTNSLLEFRNDITQRPIESYKLIVLAVDMEFLDKDLYQKLLLLMRVGPLCGVSFVICSFLGSNRLESNTVVIRARRKKVSIIENDKTVESAMVDYNDAQKIINDCESFCKNLRTAKLPTVRFYEIHDKEKFWDRDSIDGLTFCVGRYGLDNIEITIGDEVNQRHNALITGAVGQGKSNLISDIIHSLCQRYSPNELELYLLDFKEGVTFKAFSNIGQEEYLPHAKTLGLESDVSFGLAVLNSLFAEYKRRMALLKKENLKSLKEYRTKHPDAYMPRIVAIIDEFQMMFGDDSSTGNEIAEILEKSVRLFRAAGIHFILASQTIGGNMALATKKDSIFAQVPIRIALKNSLDESRQTLGLNNPAAAYLRPREAIINLDYGEVSQNKKAIIAFADEKELIPMRKIWWEKAKDTTVPPYVFEGQKRITIKDSENAIEKLKSQGKHAALIGEKISINGDPVAIPMKNEIGKNIAIFGSCEEEHNQIFGMMQSMMYSLASQSEGQNARFVFFDFGNKNICEDKAYAEFAELMKEKGYTAEFLDEKVFIDTVNEITQNADDTHETYIFTMNMDKCHSDMTKLTGFDAPEEEPEKEEPSNGIPDFTFTVPSFTSQKAFTFEDLVNEGPEKGIHFIGSWIKSSSFKNQLGFNGANYFNTKIFLRIDRGTVQSMANPLIMWSPVENRGLISDPVELSKELTFIPYSPLSSAEK